VLIQRMDVLKRDEKKLKITPGTPWVRNQPSTLTAKTAHPPPFPAEPTIIISNKPGKAFAIPGFIHPRAGRPTSPWPAQSKIARRRPLPPCCSGPPSLGGPDF